MAVNLKRPQEIERMRAAGGLVAEAFALLAERMQPGVRLRELDQLVAEFLERRGAEPLYKGYRGSGADHPPFPGVICASVNQEVCHGIPNGRQLHEGDIIGIDIGLKYNGYCGDACVTYGVGRIAPETQHFLDVAQQCLQAGIAAARPGGFLNDIGNAIETYADSQGVTVVQEWGGHGIGKALHEPPSVSHVRSPGRGLRLRPGMVFTIEPMINAGARDWVLLDDGWTVVTKDGSLSAQFEHTVAITRDGTEVLTKP